MILATKHDRAVYEIERSGFIITVVAPLKPISSRYKDSQSFAAFGWPDKDRNVPSKEERLQAAYRFLYQSRNGD